MMYVKRADRIWSHTQHFFVDCHIQSVGATGWVCFSKGLDQFRGTTILGFIFRKNQPHPRFLGSMLWLVSRQHT